MSSVYEISLLLDFYGQLLTNKQFEIMDLYFNNDYSLGELAEHFGITRQAVHDNIKRGKNILTNMEDKLKLLDKFELQKQKGIEILACINEIDSTKLDDKENERLNKIKENVDYIIRLN